MAPSDGQKRLLIKRAIRLILISLIPLISSIVTIPLVNHDSEFASGEPVGSDAAICIVALVGLLFSIKPYFAVNPVELLSVIFLALWGTGVSSEYNSTALGVEVVFLGLVSGSQVSRESRKAIWNVLACSAVCWISSSLYGLGVAFFFWLCPILDQLQDGHTQSRIIHVCALTVAMLLLLFYQHMILAPIASVGISTYVSQRKDVNVPERMIANILAVIASVLIHPLLTVLNVVVLFVAYMQFDRGTHFKDNDHIESLIGVVLLRELVMPSPGLSRFGSISTMTSLLLCMMLGIILNQYAKRIIQKIGYLFEDHSFEIVLSYLFLCLFQRTISVTPDLWITVIVGTTISVLYAFTLLLLRSHIQSDLSVSSLLLMGSVWLTCAIALSALLPFRPKSWYDSTSEQQMARCANRILLGQGAWSDVEYSSKFAVSNTDAYYGGETATCRTIHPDNINVWKQKKVLVVGDSVGRFAFYGVANRLVSNEYGFPAAKYHADIHASENLVFHWAAFINETINATTMAESADLVIVSLGLWDKLWRTKTVEQYGDGIREFLVGMNALGKKPKIAWVEMTPTIEQNLIGPEKQQYLKEADADLWRDQVRNAISVYKGDISIIPTKHVVSGRMSHDGVHYDMHVYMLIAETILRGML